MATRSSFNKNNSAVKRIMQEARELQNDPSTEYSAAPLEDNLFEWHCTLRGAPDTDFEGGLYHFRILLPAEYPFRPPSLMMLTPSGRFETNTKLCISFTNYHEELWQPAWGVRTAIIGLQGFLPLKGQAAMGIGSMEAPSSERKRLAKLSRDWVCPQCKIPNHEHLPDNTPQVQSDSQAWTSSEMSKSAEEGGGGERGDAADTVTAAAQRPPDELGDTPDRCALGCEPGKKSDASVPPSLPRVGSSDSDGASHSQKLRDSSSKSESASTSATVTRATNDTERGVERQVEIVSGTGPVSPASAPVGRSRPPIVLDAAISVLLILVAALLARKLL